MRRLFALLTATFLFCCEPLFGLSSPGRAGAEFLKIEPGGRAAALGGAFSALGDDAFSPFYNPASLATVERFEAAFQYNRWFQDINQNVLSVLLPLRRHGTLGFSINFTDAGDIDRTTVSSGQAGKTLGTFSANDLAAGVSWGRPLTQRFSVGATLKYLRSSIDSVGAQGVAVDLGLKGRFSDRWTLGISLLHLGSGLRFESVRNPLPSALRIGNAFSFFDQRLNLTLDLVKYRFEDIDVQTGVEFVPVDIFALRVGYSSDRRDVNEGLSLGAGFRIQGFSLDYAYVPFGELGNTHRVSMGIQFGPTREQTPLLAPQDTLTPEKQPSATQKLGTTVKEPNTFSIVPFRWQEESGDTWIIRAVQNLVRGQLYERGYRYVEENARWILSGTLIRSPSGTLIVKVWMENSLSGEVHRSSAAGSSKDLVRLSQALTSDLPID